MRTRMQDGILGGVPSWQRFSAWRVLQTTLLDALVVTMILPISILDSVAEENQ
jgi:hypothetical protein